MPHSLYRKKKLRINNFLRVLALTASTPSSADTGGASQASQSGLTSLILQNEPPCHQL